MDKLTERLTKDLNGYTEYFANELENLIGKRADELAPLYRRLQKTAVEQLEQLNKELAAVPEAKRKSKRLRVQMQKQYVDHILPDLELAKAAQDPYVTEVLCGTFEYGYYTQAYSLEQVAKVPVTVSILNRAGVLGLIANDWVGDGHTYSDRIRANTDLVAKNAEKVVQDLVTKRMSYNEAAHSLKDKIGECYSNAVRIVRTEMTRANSLGTSYAAMENADILDGKYRDAVYDGRTSAMCAHDADYSRANPYPLNYDTPANPGVPGARIPNHPNCRCRWCMVLSAIGVEKRGKIARKNDTKDSFGENYYTEAETFDDYAKERGLPSVKEMLNGDNPKRYLRPGETLEDLNKVIRQQKSEIKKATLFEKDVDYMSKSFRPKYTKGKSVKVGTTDIDLQRVTNSKFMLYADTAETRRSKAVRLTEKQLQAISEKLPKPVELSDIAVIDFDKHGLNTKAIGGYDKTTGFLYVNSKYDTVEKIQAYVGKVPGNFANSTEYAPLLHELGHKYYENCIKTLAKSQNMSYNRAKEVIDNRITEYIHIRNSDGVFLEKAVSWYASDGYDKHAYTEVIAECFSVASTNSTAKELLDLLD